MSVSIIIVNYNSAHDIEVSIRSIYEHVSDIKFEILVVDNNSPERDIELLSRKFHEVKFFFLKNNLGFAKANNYAFNEAKYEFILFLNPDTILVENCISPVAAFIKNNKDTGACGVKLLNEDKSFQFSFGRKMSFLYEAAEAFMFIGLYRKIYYKILRNKIKNKIPVKVEWVSGAFLFIKRDVFAAAGKFSGNFFLNYEDIDLCAKISEKNFLNYYFPEFSCVHLDSKSQKKNYEAFVVNRYKSRLLFAKEHYNFLKRIIVRGIHLLGLVLRLLTVDFLYKGSERAQRKSGYKISFLLYMGISR